MMNKSIFICLVFLLVFVGSALAAKDAEQPEELKKLLDVNQYKAMAASLSNEISSDNNLRLQAVKEAAEILGTEAGYQYRYGIILNSVETIMANLDQIYNFDAYLMHRGKVLPAIISEGGPAERKENLTLSFAKKTFQIIQDSELILTKPNWRVYLKKPKNKPFDIHSSLYPLTPQEVEVWEEAVIKGWKNGIDQADHVFEISLNKLTRDIIGLINFKTLALQNIVSKPLLATGVSDVEISEAGKKLQIGKALYRLVNYSEFKDSNTWTIKAAQ